uniref:Battenin n=1 Tax=Poecilia formosa TaxID=48698 RepID=A0A087YNU4_POEFO
VSVDVFMVRTMERSASINADQPQQPGTNGCCVKWRNWWGFWLLGLCNNFAYVVMLSAAHDILEKQESKNSTVTLAVGLRAGNSRNSSRYDCSPVSTGAVLLADILPTLFIKISAPFVIHKVPYGFRVLFCVAMAAASFLLVSFSFAVWLSIVGVIFASISSGLGELSFLSLSVFFNRNVLEGWGSGTGAAGVAGSLLYAGLIQAHLSPRTTLLIMLIVPFAMLASYFFLLVPEPSLPQWSSLILDKISKSPISGTVTEDRTMGPVTLQEKLAVTKGLLPFVIPLGLVYFAEYFINQGLMELLFFHNSSLSHAEQYRWYQTLYQVGVFVSRSSLRLKKFRKTCIFSLLQMVNAVFLIFAVLFQFLPSIWIVFGIILYEGLLGGVAYVNTFHFISKETESRYREFAMATSSVGDSLGIALAGAAAFPTHSYFCSL